MPASAQTRIIFTVHIVDDDASFRTAIERLVRATGYAVRTYSSAIELLNSPLVNGPGCILLDMYMPGLSGLEVQQALVTKGEGLPIIFISAHGDIPATVRAMKAGALDFLTKPVSKEALLRTIALALARDTETRSLREKSHETELFYQTLTPRQRTVFEGVVTGKLNKQMAAELGVAERTIKAHRAQVMKKMRVDSVAGLVHLALQLQDQSPRAATD
jgi:FixJ family two-component response regulator